MKEETATGTGAEKRYLKDNHQKVIVDKEMIKGITLGLLVISITWILELILIGWTSYFESESHKESIRSLIYSGLVATGFMLILFARVDLSYSQKVTKIYRRSFIDLTYILNLLGLKLKTVKKEYYTFCPELLVLPKNKFVIKDCGDFCEVTCSRQGIEHLDEIIEIINLQGVRS